MTTSIGKKAVRILNESATRKINFHLGGLHISGTALGRVSHAIETGAIRVIHKPSLGTYAEYDPKNNTISLKSKEMGGRYERTHRSMFERSYVIHEATHAIVDMVKATTSRRLANEAAANLAQALYLYEEMGDVSYKHAVEKGYFPQEIHRACIAVIEQYKMANRDVRLGDPNYKPIMRAIKNHRKYAKIRWTDTEGTDADGVAPQRTTPATGGGRSKRPAIASTRVRVNPANPLADSASGFTYERPPIRSRTPVVPSPQMLKNRTQTPRRHQDNVVLGQPGVRQHGVGQRGVGQHGVGQHGVGQHGVGQHPHQRSDPYSVETWRDMQRIRPNQRTKWMQTNRPQAYQEHRNNVKLLSQTVDRQLRTDPYSADMRTRMSRIRPSHRKQWMRTNHPLAYQEHRNNVRQLRQTINQQFR